MPTYEYECEACGHEWEATQSIKDDPLKKCPACKKMKAKRQISAGTGFILKGGGWYSDLYSSSASSKKSDSSTSESSASSSDKSPTKSDTKTKKKKSDTKSTSSSD